MDAAALIGSLQRFADLLPALVQAATGGSAEIARWRPADGHWSILEIVRHLGDEEVDDFRKRLRLTLEDPNQDWPPIDPPRWAIERNYNEADLEQAVDRFVHERRASIDWLQQVGEVEWATRRVHPKFGSMHAGDLLTAWAAHDALHARQIAKRMHQLAAMHGGNYSATYAGEWTA